MKRAGESFVEVLRLCTQITLVDDEVFLFNADFDGDHVGIVQESAQTVSKATSRLEEGPTHFNLSLEGFAVVLGVMLTVSGKGYRDNNRDVMGVDGWMRVVVKTHDSRRSRVDVCETAVLKE